jgi:hypothetical protein
MKSQTILLLVLAGCLAFVFQFALAGLLIYELAQDAAPPAAFFAAPGVAIAAPVAEPFPAMPPEQPVTLEELKVVRGAAVAVKDYTLTGPFTHGNLSIVLIHGPDTMKNGKVLPLQNALEQNLAVVHEGAIAIDNRANVPLFIQAGDIIKGGTQDRVLPYDQLIPPGVVGMPLAAFCVEAGRSHPRGLEVSESFQSATEQLPGRQLHLAARYRHNQQEVWRGVSLMQANLTRNLGRPVQSALSQTSLQLTLENDPVQQAVQEPLAQLLPLTERAEDVIGVAIAINGQIQSADIYASSTLCRDLWPKLLKANIVAALAERAVDAAAPPTTDAIRQFLMDAETGQASQQTLPSGTRSVRHESDSALLFETCNPAAANLVVHRSYLAK